ncbi:CLUMA_CG004299, isoform A [Clunio marinus]|uniref:CLUMA_CG004299, isoform A n=1 Tax=Clunio marinus TaxID=568069 RepID=A0A1J1HRE7_9DIPT|nr:CLUMA_CG004299, isoform A [Clunio marinus]
MMDMLKWMSIKQRIYFNTLKIESGESPEYLNNRMKMKEEAVRLNLRSQKNYLLPQYKSDIGQNSLFYKGLNIYLQ